MTRNQNEYALQPMATAMRAVAKGDEALWADTVHAHWSAGHYAPSKGNHAQQLRALFRAIRLLERGADRQKKQAGDLSRFLASVWGLQKAYVTAGEGDIDATRELRERWGDVQLPPIDGGFGPMCAPIPPKRVELPALGGCVEILYDWDCGVER